MDERDGEPHGRGIRRGVRRLLSLSVRRRDRWERDVEDEIKLHLALRAEQLAAAGRAPEAAYREAVAKFGRLAESRAQLMNAARQREEQMHHTEFVGDLMQDLTFAMRTLRRRKAWAAVTILTLGLGIGATTAVFSVVSSVILHAVPYPDGDRVVSIVQMPTSGNQTGIQVSITIPVPLITAWRAGTHALEALEPYRSAGVRLRVSGAGIGGPATEGDDATPVTATYTLPTFAAFAGQQPIIGRMYTAQDVESGARVLLLSEDLWRSRFGGDESVLKRTVELGDSIYNVIGVVPSGLRLPNVGSATTDVWLPLDLGDKNQGLRGVGRLRPGATAATAATELDSITARAHIYPDARLPFTASVVPPSALVSFHDSLLALSVAATLVLLIACANVAHLLLARALSRRRELAVRTALGAAQSRLLRQSLTESLVLTLAGAATGLVVGWGGLEILVALRPLSMSELRVARLDATTLGVTMLIAVLTAVVFGVLGALQLGRHSPHDSLKAGALSTSGSAAQHRARSLLIVSEMALSAMLLVGAAMVIQSFLNLQRTDLGFDPHGLYAVDVALPASRYPTAETQKAGLAEVMARVRGISGVRDVVAAGTPPGARSFSVGAFEIEGEAPPPAATSSFIDVNDVQPAFFAMMGIPFTEGTTFTDTSGTSAQVIVNAGFARKKWKPGEAIGHRIRVAYQGHGTWLTIVGVVRDAMVNGPGGETSAPLLYTPSAASRSPNLIVRTTGSAQTLAAITALLRARNPRAHPSVIDVEQIVARSMAAPRFTMLLLTLFTAFALLLAAVGLYGVMAHSVAQRTREIGIRMALGATASTIARTVVGRGVALATMGAGIGLTGAFWGTRFLRTMLYGVTPLDITSFVIGGVVLIAAALIACLVPTRQAVSVDPLSAIRAE